MCVEGEQYSIHTIFCDITLGFWVFVILNTVLLKTMRSLSCQDNHGGCIGYCREIQHFSFLDYVGLGQHNVWCTTAAHAGFMGGKKTAWYMFACWYHLESPVSACDTAVSLVSGETAMVPLHHWFGLGRRWIHLPGNSYIIYKIVTTTHLRPFQITEIQTKRRWKWYLC